MSGLAGHLATGATTLCRCWALRRADGLVRGFTDHDGPLAFDGMEFRPNSGMSASALAQGTGLAVDNGEALGALTDDGITETEIEQGRLDGAEVTVWRVNWADPAQREVEFRGHLGEISREGALFRAELRGLADLLNQPVGRAYQARCDAVLGDARCGVEAGQAGFSFERTLQAVEDARLRLDWPDAPVPGWFARGRVEVLDGEAAGLSAPIRDDRQEGARRVLDLWRAIPGLEAGDRLRVVAGCDKRAETCRAKFDNLLNFRGFPNLPGEDWLMAVPSAGQGR
ncbi:DUF2163 domain-containing protein [Limimaricola pyoseonensis]|uniref:Bacteriophage phiJL001 Gp84 C-terminal domain-containing protein n=1 Tax=Limimaricola pyoseonensis TaxID=521013 RepID=A0A1G7AWF8_9RHOB|nr:DUF2163 domain-containing protein [Limimaricola pyoseonensis]SDE19111.1 phage conserved hypothetical protein BR0599 [Limimaricola pyoseonensis]